MSDQHLKKEEAEKEPINDSRLNLRSIDEFMDAKKNQNYLQVIEEQKSSNHINLLNITHLMPMMIRNLRSRQINN